MNSEAEDFLGIGQQANINDAIKSEIPTRKKLIIYFVTWIVAFLIASCCNPLAIIYIHMFPMGLLAIVFNLEKSVFAPMLFPAIWLFYISHGIIILSVTKKMWFYILYAVFVIVLLLNAAGCNMMMHELGKIKG